MPIAGRRNSPTVRTQRHGRRTWTGDDAGLTSDVQCPVPCPVQCPVLQHAGSAVAPERTVSAAWERDASQWRAPTPPAGTCYKSRMSSIHRQRAPSQPRRPTATRRRCLRLYRSAARQLHSRGHDTRRASTTVTRRTACRRRTPRRAPSCRRYPTHRARRRPHHRDYAASRPSRPGDCRSPRRTRAGHSSTSTSSRTKLERS